MSIVSKEEDSGAPEEQERVWRCVRSPDQPESWTAFLRSAREEAPLNKEPVTCTVERVLAPGIAPQNKRVNFANTTGKEYIKSGAAQIRVAEWKRKCPRIGTLFNEERNPPWCVLGTVRGCR